MNSMAPSTKAISAAISNFLRFENLTPMPTIICGAQAAWFGQERTAKVYPINPSLHYHERHTPGK